jgi:hypothetical protein
LDSRWVLQKGCTKATGKCPKAIGKPLDNSQRVLESRWEMPKYLLGANRRGGRIAQRLLAKSWEFAALFSEALRLCLHLLRVEGAAKHFKNSSQFFYFALSSHTTFSQTQTGAKDPLRPQKFLEVSADFCRQKTPSDSFSQR